MTRFIRLSLLAAATTALVACGGSGAKIGGGKQGAAQALFEASQPAAQGGNGNLLRALASAADTINAEVEVDCAKSGSVKLKLDLDTNGTGGGTDLSFKYDLEYNSCNEDGVNEFDGKMTMEFKAVSDGFTSAKVELKMKGKIEISGEIDDFLDADVTQTIDVSATNATSGSVTIKLDGKISTGSGSYAYANESITITAGAELPVAEEDDGNS
ncbi:hypothetical protein [Hyalangium rubrum]|uniref:Lipoprotein n=1 Tax=Hyalangium rubrum TaxID=3103134 RepID=A0ABU5H5P8_9BACT|nr:hypothetical protein [Hyalangium sp. s54d21]MDY7228660.1 hypothetical protein [Hyalangium sp. s54d21]